MPRTRDDQWKSSPPKYENNRDEKLDALILNTTEKGRWCIDFDPFKNHVPLTMKGWFIELERLNGNQNMFLMYAEGPDMSGNYSKEDKIRVSCIQNCDSTRIKYPPKWNDENRVETTLVAWDDNHTGESL